MDKLTTQTLKDLQNCVAEINRLQAVITAVIEAKNSQPRFTKTYDETHPAA